MYVEQEPKYHLKSIPTHSTVPCRGGGTTTDCGDACPSTTPAAGAMPTTLTARFVWNREHFSPGTIRSAMSMQSSIHATSVTMSAFRLTLLPPSGQTSFMNVPFGLLPLNGKSLILHCIHWGKPWKQRAFTVGIALACHVSWVDVQEVSSNHLYFFI